MGKNDTYQVHPIGFVRRSEIEIFLEILEPYRPALKHLDQFSHVIAFWWADQHDNEQNRNQLQCELPYAPGTVAGVFATRAEYRPNPIAMTTCPIMKVDEGKGIVRVTNIDAFDGTPLLDLKGYFPVCDRVKEVKAPKWTSQWPEWMPEEGLGFFEDET